MRGWIETYTLMILYFTQMPGEVNKVTYVRNKILYFKYLTQNVNGFIDPIKDWSQKHHHDYGIPLLQFS